jgi:hypothetical protein
VFDLQFFLIENLLLAITELLGAALGFPGCLHALQLLSMQVELLLQVLLAQGITLDASV